MYCGELPFPPVHTGLQIWEEAKAPWGMGTFGHPVPLSHLCMNLTGQAGAHCPLVHRAGHSALVMEARLHASVCHIL